MPAQACSGKTLRFTCPVVLVVAEGGTTMPRYIYSVSVCLSVLLGTKQPLRRRSFSWDDNI